MITLTYNTTNIEILQPDFGDTDTLRVARVDNNTLSGCMNLLRDTLWPQSRILNVTGKVYDDGPLRTFIKNTLGKVITVTYYDGNEYSGIILIPKTNITEIRPAIFLVTLNILIV